MIDWSHIDDLRQDMGDAFPDLSTLFLSEVQTVIDRLHQAPDPARLEADLHFLKGAALSFGFTDFARACSGGEQMAAAGRAGQVDLAAVLDCFARSRALFLAGLAQRGV